jgi:DNA-directed RNA polymerase subunit RPC12/RpoP
MILAVPEDTRGKKVRCKYCSTTFIVPVRKPVGKRTSKSEDVQVVE